MSKFKIVLSDFHLGAGRQEEGNALEDFTSDREFAALVDQVIAESNGNGADVELIFNGDMFEMFQLPHVDTFDPAAIYRSEECYSSTEPDSVRKVAIAIAGHPLLFDALRRFIQPGPPCRSVTFVKGNHDVLIHWPAVHDFIRQAVGATGERAPLVGFAARCVSREGIYVEHGNQYSLSPDRVPNMDEPFDPKKPGYLTWPPGAKFVMDVFSEWERKRYWLDGVKPMTSLIWYALAYDLSFALWAIPKLLRALPGLAFGAALGIEDPRDELAKKLEGADQEALAAQYETDADFRTQFNADLARALAPLPEESPVAGQFALAPGADPVAMGDQARNQVRMSLYEAAERCAVESGAKVVLFGHTHEPGAETLPSGATYINTGTWTWSGDFTRAGAKTWRELFKHPGKFADDRTLSFAHIDYDDAGQPVGRCDIYRTGGDVTGQPVLPEKSLRSKPVVDVHCHVGLLGDEHPHWGRMSEWYTRQTVYRAFLLYGRLQADDVSDRTLRDATERAIGESKVDHVVCLALDPVYDPKGQRREDLSHMWVDNDYILDLRRSLGPKVLFGASVHPYDPEFRSRVAKYVDQGAVLLKWLPSAQQIDLADERARDALTFLATARNGAPLPLLLHNGPEYAIMSSDPRTSSYDFLSWTKSDRLWNSLRGPEQWHQPLTRKIGANLRAGLGAGAVVIFAHCGLPYYAPGLLGQFLEHSDFRTVSRYLNDFPADGSQGGRCYADVSACVTPFRRGHFRAINRLPPQSLLFGSDFPTPVFELSADLGEMLEDFRAVLAGYWDRIVVPEDNLIDVNYRELQHFFPDHPMFTNFDALL